MVKVKPDAKVITIVPAQDAYGSISIVKAGGKVITIEWSADALSADWVVELLVDGLTHGLTAAEVTAVFRGQGLGRKASPNPWLGVICDLAKFPEKIEGKLGERKGFCSFALPRGIRALPADLCSVRKLTWQL